MRWILGFLSGGPAAQVAAAVPVVARRCGDPGSALIDSDLDWGQDFGILVRELRARRIPEARIGFFGTLDPCTSDPGGPAGRADPTAPRLIALGNGNAGHRLDRPQRAVQSLPRPLRFPPGRLRAPGRFHFDFAFGDGFDWLKPLQPVARLGADLRLYRVSDR